MAKAIKKTAKKSAAKKPAPKKAVQSRQPKWWGKGYQSISVFLNERRRNSVQFLSERIWIHRTRIVENARRKSNARRSNIQ